MQTTTRPHEHAGGYRGRHGPQISISDDNHHVTDAISSLYEYGEQQNLQQQHQQPPPPRARPDARPLSFLPSAHDEIRPATPSPENAETLRPARPLSRTQSDKLHSQTQHSHSSDYMVGRSNSAGHGPINVPTSPLRSPAETAAASFPLNDIDYESSPAAVAQELSNLQAIRRMSMDVNVVGDPDLPSFSPSFGIPTVPPTDSTDEDDASRLFWVPARLHPELAPKEFKTFLDSRVDSIKRRSGEFSLTPDGPSRSGSDGGLGRKKSMLSRQIDNSEGRGAEGYQDGAERLDRKRSQSDKSDSRRSSGVSNLQELEMLMHDPQKVMQRLSLESKPKGEADAPITDMPILPAAPGGNTLRRSTRTTYRKGSLKQGERLPPSKRAARAIESDSDDVTSPKSPTMGHDTPFAGITRVQTEPALGLNKIPEKQRPENFSRPGRGSRSRVIPQITGPPSLEISKAESIPPAQKSPPPSQDFSTKSATPPVPPVPSVHPFTSREPKPFVSQIASNGRTTANIPAINEPHDDQRPLSQQTLFPDRKSSIEASGTRGVRASAPPSVIAPIKRPIGSQSQQQNEHQPQTLQHMAANPSPLPGNSTRTDSLSFIPTLTEDKRAAAPEPKKPQKRSGWSWGSLLGSEEKDKQLRISDDDDIRETPRNKSRSKLSGTRTGDSTRLDVLQTSIDSSRPSSSSVGRESLVLDRGDIKLEEERKKESSRKSADSRADGKKEKDANSGLFSSLFGVGKKNKSERDSASSNRKSSSLRPHSPEPPRPALKPDVDYNWTRFSILEERAIYRMAHIKLANPRRALYSQVLLSNFMYSYLAKVQQMHPQMQIPQSAAQKAAQSKTQGAAGGAAAGQGQAARKKEEGQPEEFYQYQRYQQQLQAQDLAAQQQQQQQQQSSPSHSPSSPQQSYNDVQNSSSQLPYFHQQQQAQSLQPNGVSPNYLEDSSAGVGTDGYGYQRPAHSAYQYQTNSTFEDEDDSDEEFGVLGGGVSSSGRGSGAGDMW